MNATHPYPTWSRTEVNRQIARSSKTRATYEHPAVGKIAVSKKGAATIFDFGEWSSEMASRKNPDGTISFITIVPGFTGLEFVMGKNTLTLRDAQHEYVFAPGGRKKN